jgi:hypothetical protein
VEDNIKLDIEKAVCKKADQMHLAQDKAQWWALVNAAMNCEFHSILATSTWNFDLLRHWKRCGGLLCFTLDISYTSTICNIFSSVITLYWVTSLCLFFLKNTLRSACSLSKTCLTINTSAQMRCSSPRRLRCIKFPWKFQSDFSNN